MKAGLATLFCILVLASKWKYKFIYFILALSIHFSSILFIIFYYLSKKLSITISIIFWFTSLIISYFNISGFILKTLTEKLNFNEVLGIVRYLEGNDLGYKVGFRIDFVAYSILPFILMFISKKVFKNKDEDIILLTTNDKIIESIKFVNDGADWYYNNLIEKLNLNNYWFEPSLASQNIMYETTIQNNIYN